MAGLRRMDAFAKTRPELRSKNTVGGVITLVALSISILLFLGQIFLYLRGSSKDNLFLSQSLSVPILSLDTQENMAAQLLSRSATVKMHVLITFPHLACQQLDVAHDGASLGNGELKKIHPKHAIRLRPPYSHELVGHQHIKMGGGCTVEGHMRVPVVAGKLQITLNRRTWQEAAATINRHMMMHMVGKPDKEGIGKMLGNKFNVSHYIHYVRFDETFSPTGFKPLENRAHLFINDYGGIAVQECKVELVPTYLGSWMPSAPRKTFQMSVVDSEILPQHMVDSGVNSLPGVVVDYDFSPLTVHHSAGRDNIFVFIGSLLSIVGGVFVTVGLLSGCLVSSAKAVAKKID